MSVIVEYFQTKDLQAFILEGRKRNELGTCDSDDEMPKGKLCMKECHCLRDYVLFKEWLQKKEFQDIDPRKEIDQ